MRCPKCRCVKSMVLKTERPINEGMEEGDLKKRTRKCRQCAGNFVTFEVHESTFRQVTQMPPLTRRPLLNEGTKWKRRAPLTG